MNNYEWGVCEYLKLRKLHYYRISDVCKAINPSEGLPLKNFDFLITGENQHLLLEIKGRKASGKTRIRFENWISGEDISSLVGWQNFFGSNFQPLICFVYILDNNLPPLKTQFSEFKSANIRFALFGIKLDEYILKSALRSVKWNTFSLKSADFIKSVKPLSEFLPFSNSELNLSELA